MKKQVSLGCLFGGLALALSFAGQALAQAYPNKPIRVVIPLAAGSPPEYAFRVLATEMTKNIGQPLVIENRGGAGGTIGATAVMKSAPDGYTMLYGSITSLAIGPNVFKSAGIDPVKQFAPVGQVAAAPSVIGIPATLDVKTLKEFIALLKANPGKYNYGSPGPASPPHVSGALFAAMAGVDMVHIAFGSPANVITAISRGEAHLFIETINSIGPQVKAGRMRMLAVAAPKRSSFMPDVPTIEEAGLPGFESGTWSGLLAPAGTPAPILQRLNAEIRKGADTKELREVMAQQGGEVVTGSPEDFARLIASESAKWAKAVVLAGVKPE
jgi:tripartite-type tricarboxylate transporter receptor subunit TctC